MSLQVKKGTFSPPAAIGNFTVSGVGFQGKALLLFATRQTAAGFAAGKALAAGFAVSSSQRWAVCSAADDNVAAANVGRRHSDTKCLMGLTDGTPTVDMELDFVAWTADGFTLNAVDAPASASLIVHYLVLGGADLAAAEVGRFQLNATSGQQTVTTTNGPLDCLLFLSAGLSSAPPGNGTSEGLMLGAACQPGQRGVCVVGDLDAANPAQAFAYQRSSRCIAVLTAGGALDAEADFVSFGASTGFTINILSTSGVQDYVGWLALKGGTYRIGDESEPSAAGLKQILGLGVQPRGLVVFDVNFPRAAAVDATNGRLSLGATDGVSQGCVWASEKDAVTPTDANMNTRTDAVLLHGSDPATVDDLAALSTLANPDGFALNFSSLDATKDTFVWLALADTLPATAPDWIVEVTFDTDPLSANPVWMDVSRWVKRFTTFRGRQRELDRFETGRAEVVFDNTDGRFLLGSLDSSQPYYPNVVPRRRIRIRCDYGGILYGVWAGYVEDWPPYWDLPDEAEVTVTCVDGFDVLANAGIGDGSAWPQEPTGTRIGRVLDAVGWPADARSLDTGQSQAQAITINLGDNTKALDHVQLAGVDTETGAVFMNGAGTVVFHDRHRRLKSPYLTSQATFGDGGGSELMAEMLQTDGSSQLMVNDARGQRIGGTAQQATDSASSTRYGPRTKTRTGLLTTTESEVLSQQQFIVARFKDPVLRFPAIVVRPLADATVAVQALSREISDRITVKKRPKGTTVTITQDCHLEAIGHTVDPQADEWTWTAQLSSADQNSYWILGDAVYGVLGSTTRLAY